MTYAPRSTRLDCSTLFVNLINGDSVSTMIFFSFLFFFFFFLIIVNDIGDGDDFWDESERRKFVIRENDFIVTYKILNMGKSF